MFYNIPLWTSSQWSSLPPLSFCVPSVLSSPMNISRIQNEMSFTRCLRCLNARMGLYSCTSIASMDQKPHLCLTKWHAHLLYISMVHPHVLQFPQSHKIILCLQTIIYKFPWRELWDSPFPKLCFYFLLFFHCVQ